MATPFATISRNPATKEASLQVAGPGAWALYAHEPPAPSSSGGPLLEGTGPGAFRLPERTPAWARFRLETAGGSAFVAERRLPMEGGYNFRDLGGFAGAGGRHVAWGKFFRTDDMAGLTGADCAYLASIPIVTVVDFRTGKERAKAPDRLPESVARALHYPIAPGFLNPGNGNSRCASADDYMLAVYRDLVLNEEITATYRRFFGHVQSGPDLPLSFHCSAGKDRTGFAAALILSALGVDKDVILADYEASNACLGGKYAAIVATNPADAPLYAVKPAFLLQALALVDEKYGSMERYLAEALDVDIQAMRARYLY